MDSIVTDPSAATAAPMASNGPSTNSPSPPPSQAGLSLNPKLTAVDEPHPRRQSLSLDPKLSSVDDAPPRQSLSLDPKLASDAKPRPSTDAALSLGSTTRDAPTTPPFSPSSMTPVLENPEFDFEGSVHVTNDIPSDKDLKRVNDLHVLDASGESHPFSSLYRGEGVAPRQLIIFIRHFFCGNCQEYLRELSASISPEALLALPEPTFITVIGCGRPELIDMYTQTTQCPFPIYADPTRKLYDLLGMTRTLELGKKPGYIQSNILFTSVQSVVQSLKTGSSALKGGDFKQVGGEFLFEDGKCVWAHRMRNTRDHAEMADITKLLGLESKKSPARKRWSHGVKALRLDGQKRSSSWGQKRSSSWGLGRGGSKGLKEKEGGKTPEVVEVLKGSKTAAV